MQKFLKNQKGVTVIAVPVKMALLAVAVTPCLSAFVMNEGDWTRAHVELLLEGVIVP